jgi:hypothetical protein
MDERNEDFPQHIEPFRRAALDAMNGMVEQHERLGIEAKGGGSVDEVFPLTVTVRDDSAGRAIRFTADSREELAEGSLTVRLPLLAEDHERARSSDKV